MNPVDALHPAGSAMPDKRARLRFAEVFGGEPDRVVHAPGRVNLIGEHTDYNDGFVMPCAIDFHAAVAWRTTGGRVLRVVADAYGPETVDIPLDAPLAVGHPVGWADYVKAMVWVWSRQGLPLRGGELAIAGNVPQGAGLSSSAALEVALAMAMREAAGLAAPTPTQLALMAQQAENDFVGCHCGNMDQLISANGQAGHALLIDCRSLDLTPVPMPSDASVLIIDSKVQRGLVDSAYNERRRQCEAVAAHFGVPALRDLSLAQLLAGQAGLEATAFRRARHVVTENARTLDAAAALRAGDLRRMGELMAQSHASMRDDFEITVPPIDLIVETVAHVVGDRGGVRMTGGGFGGCVVALVPHALVEPVRQTLAQAYRSPQGAPAEVHVCLPRAGAGPVDPA